MTGMEVKKLELLLETVRIGSLKRAAEELNYTLSGLVYQINSLEEEIGVPLLIRNHRGVSLTPAGLHLKPLFQELVDNASRVNQEIDLFSVKRRNELRIGSIPSAAAKWLPDVLKCFNDAHPDTNIRLYIGTGELHDWLQSSLIDVAVLEKSTASEYHWTPLYEDQVYVYVPCGHDLSDRDSLSLAELRNHQVLSSPYQESSAYGMVFGQLKDTEEDHTRLQIASQDGYTLLNLVSSGVACAILSSSYASVCPASVRPVPLRPSVRRSIGLARRKDSAPSVSIRDFTACSLSAD